MKREAGLPSLKCLMRGQIQSNTLKTYKKGRVIVHKFAHLYILHRYIKSMLCSREVLRTLRRRDRPGEASLEGQVRPGQSGRGPNLQIGNCGPVKTI